MGMEFGVDAPLTNASKHHPNSHAPFLRTRRLLPCLPPPSMPFSSNPVLVAAAVFLAAASPAMTQAAQAVTCGYFGTSPVVGGAYHQFYLDLTGRSGNTAVRISTVTSTLDTTVCVGTELVDDSHTTTLGDFAVTSLQENFEIPLAPGVQLVQVGTYNEGANGTLVLSISCRDTTLPAEVLEQHGGCQISTNSPTSPTMSPTANPTSNPTRNPTANPTMNPTANPTRSPTGSPTVPNIIQRWVTRYAQASTRNQMLSAGDSQTNLAAITTMQGGAEVTRNDRFGNPLWTITLATEMNAVSVASDRADNVIITGGTTGDVDGAPNQGGADAYVTSCKNPGTAPSESHEMALKGIPACMSCLRRSRFSDSAAASLFAHVCYRPVHLLTQSWRVSSPSQIPPPTAASAGAPRSAPPPKNSANLSLPTPAATSS